MPLVKYRIYELSARAVISYGRQQECAYAFQLSAAETEKCKSLSAPHEQDDNALFYQTISLSLHRQQWPKIHSTPLHICYVLLHSPH